MYMGRSIPKKYIPSGLSAKDKKQQEKQLAKSRKMYKSKKYHTRKKVSSFKSKKSKHITRAEHIYKLKDIIPSRKLAQKTGCSLNALHQIVKKGQGAYYSSGSRPNQTAHSWGYARLGSSITGGKSAAIDYHILKKGCKKSSKAMKYALKAKKRHHTGTRRVPKYKKNVKGGAAMEDFTERNRAAAVERVIDNMYKQYSDNNRIDFRESVKAEMEEFLDDTIERLFNEETDTEEREELKQALAYALSVNRDSDVGGGLSNYLRSFVNDIFETTNLYSEHESTHPNLYIYIRSLTQP